jgi:hypothetical protein
MRRVKELLRLAHELGSSKRQIAPSIGMPKSTVGTYLARAEAAGLRYADVAELDEEAVEARLFQRAERPEQRPMPDWEGVWAELGKRGVTLMLVWEEYRQQHRDGYSDSQFRRHFLNHTSASPEPRMRREHAPGAACEVDYASMTLTTGPIRSWRAITAPALSRRGPVAQETRPAPRRASRWSRPGFWRPCATACSSPWTRPTRRSGSGSPRSTRGR